MRARPRARAAAAGAARGRRCARRSATGVWPPTRACPPRARSPPTSASRVGWWSMPTRSCSPRAIWPRAAGAGHLRRRGRRRRRPPRRAGAGARPCSFDFFPGYPDLAAFPARALAARACATVLREAPDSAFGYPDPRGALELRRALAGHLRRVRGVVADQRTDRSCARAPRRRLALLARCARSRARHGRGRGSRAAAAPRDPHGARARPERRCRSTSRGRTWTALGAPASGRACSSRPPTSRRPASRSRRPAAAGLLGVGAAAGGARDRGRLRRRVPLRPRAAGGAAGPRARPGRRTWARSARRSRPRCGSGWLVLPARLVEALVGAQGGWPTPARPTLEQLALARLLESGAYDRHLRQARRRYRARRDALVAAVAAPPAGRPRDRHGGRAARDRPPAAPGRRARADAGSRPRARWGCIRSAMPT